MFKRDFDSRIFDVVAHRPWPLPDRPWVMTQTWHDLLFAHWAVDYWQLRARVPEAFEIDLFNGQAWVGIVPFRMTNVAPRGVPSLPWLSAFPELNVRTYVRVGERPGIHFFSLDAGRALAVGAARWLLNLPYYTASMHVHYSANGVEYWSVRRGRASAGFTGTYRPAGATFVAQEGSLEHFLTERYCLYHVDADGTPYRLDIHHRPWPLQPASARLFHNTMARASGITVPDVAPLLHFAERLDVVTWPPVRHDSPR